MTPAAKMITEHLTPIQKHQGVYAAVEMNGETIHQDPIREYQRIMGLAVLAAWLKDAPASFVQDDDILHGLTYLLQYRVRLYTGWPLRIDAPEGRCWLTHLSGKTESKPNLGYLVRNQRRVLEIGLYHNCLWAYMGDKVFCTVFADEAVLRGFIYNSPIRKKWFLAEGEK